MLLFLEQWHVPESVLIYHPKVLVHLFFLQSKMCFVSMKLSKQFALSQNLEICRLRSITNTEMYLLRFFKENPFAQVSICGGI